MSPYCTAQAVRRSHDIWYFWLTVQNTAKWHVSNAFDLLGVFISFSRGTQSLAVRPRTAGSSDARAPFFGKKNLLMGKKIIEKEKKKENRAQKVRADFLPRRPAAGWSLSCPFLSGRCHRAATGLIFVKRFW
jgi:hypothetical protein